jgi:hypothetical protein
LTARRDPQACALCGLEVVTKAQLLSIPSVLVPKDLTAAVLENMMCAAFAAGIAVAGSVRGIDRNICPAHWLELREKLKIAQDAVRQFDARVLGSVGGRQ